MSYDDDVEMLSNNMGNLQCQESDTKDVSSETIDKINKVLVIRVQKVVRHKQQERDGSCDEDYIPMKEHRRRLRNIDTRQKELFSEDDTPKDNPVNDDNIPKMEGETLGCSRDYSDTRPLEKMEIDSIPNKTSSLEAEMASEIPGKVPPNTKDMIKNMLALFQATLAL